MRTFYVRPESAAGYGSGDGTSFENAWNGFGAVDWGTVAANDPATLWVCGNPEAPGAFVTVYVELSYLKQTHANALHSAARTDPRREPAESV